jgi:hypothetical protein
MPPAVEYKVSEKNNNWEIITAAPHSSRFKDCCWRFSAKGAIIAAYEIC